MCKISKIKASETDRGFVQECKIVLTALIVESANNL